MKQITFLTIILITVFFPQISFANASIYNINLEPAHNSYVFGETVKIKWMYKDIKASSPVNIIFKGLNNNLQCSITDKINISKGKIGIYWKFPHNCFNNTTQKNEKIQKGNYTIEVMLKGNSSIKSQSKKFKLKSINISKIGISNINKNISGNTLKIIAPRKNTDWLDDRIQIIKWKFHSLSKNPPIPTKINISLYDKSGKKLIRKIATKHSIKGYKIDKIYTYQWKIPINLYKFPGLYRLKIISKEYKGVSDIFHISKSIKNKTEKIYPHISNSERIKKAERKFVVPSLLDRSGSNATSPPPKGVMRIGFKNSYSSTPLDITYKEIKNIYRGYIFFHLEHLYGKKIFLKKATLHLKKNTNYCSCSSIYLKNNNSVNIIEEQCVGCDCYCMKSIYYPIEKWKDFETKDKFLMDFPKQKVLNLNITYLVRKWINGQIKNHGLEFTGIVDNGDNNRICINGYDDIYLKLEYMIEGNNIPKSKKFPMPDK
jgi:hypothetical protein